MKLELTRIRIYGKDVLNVVGIIISYLFFHVTLFIFKNACTIATIVELKAKIHSQHMKVILNPHYDKNVLCIK